MHNGEFDLHDHHKARFELRSWSGESIHANTAKTTFQCNEARIEVHETHFVMWNFLWNQKPLVYMDTWMLIGLIMFQIGNQLVVSCSWSNKKQPIVALSNMKAEYRNIVMWNSLVTKTIFRFGIVSGYSYYHLLW